MSTEHSKLNKTLGPVMLWALGVGYVISGMYFGWNLGLPLGGPFGLLAATVLVTIMYVAFVLGYAELTCAFPRAGGAFVYANHALGPEMGYLAGLAQWVEFVFAPPAIASAIGAYFTLFFPSIHPTSIAVAAYGIFTALNIWGVRQSAIFELVITVLAVFELLLFSGITGLHFSWQAFAQNALPNGWSGTFAALPYAIWFYLAIEGLANVAEETKKPEKNLPRGYVWAILTLVALAFIVLFSAVGVAGWESVVYKPGSAELSDSPLPLALARIVGGNHFLYHLLVGIGLCGLLASFHGIILVAGRATMELGRTGYAPAFLGDVLKKNKTPASALLMNMIIGIGALFTEKTPEIITLAVFGALTLYVLSMASLFALRKDRPRMARPFKVPGYPWVPGLALGLSLLCLASMAYYNAKIGLIYVALLAAGYAWYYLAIPKAVRKREFSVMS